MSLHDPKATFRTRSQIPYRAHQLRRRQNRQGGLLPSATVATLPVTPGVDEKRRRQRYERATRRDPWCGIQERNARAFHDYTILGGVDAYTFTGSDGDSWNPLWTFTQGSGDINTNRGRMVTGTGGFDGVTAYIDTGLANVTVSIDVEIPTNDAQFPEVRFRFDPGNYDYIRLLFEPHNDLVFLHDYDNDVQQTLLDSDTFAIAANDIVHIKLVGSGNELRVRLWLNADPEPSTYQLIASSSFGASNTDLAIRTVTSNLGVAITNYWDNLVITSAGIDTATGTIAVTDANDTSSITGTETISGTIAVTDANDTSTISGTETFSGTIAVTDAADTSAITGTEIFTGTIAVTDAADTSSITATHTAGSGSMIVTDADDTAAFSGTVVSPNATGTIAVTDETDTSDITAGQAFPGTISMTDAQDTSSITGTVVYNPVGTIAVTDADDVASLTGSTFPNPTGTFSITDAADSASLAGIVANPVSGTITITEEADRTSISAQRYGKAPQEMIQPGPIFRGGRARRRYYNANQNPVTGP